MTHSTRLLTRVRAIAPAERIFFARRRLLRQLGYLLRWYQWIKNVLVFVPALAAHRLFEGEILASAAVAFVIFSLTASGVYVLNDIVDIAGDRQHVRKRHRPLAAGTLPLRLAVALVPLLWAVAGLAVALLVPRLGYIVLLYVGLNVLYSLWLKRVKWVDVLLLATLYMLRVVAGAVATGIAVSGWLVGFGACAFISLALLKRYTELWTLRTDRRQQLAGRGYRLDDRQAVGWLGVVSAVCSAAVIALYIVSAEVVGLYRHPAILWLVAAAWLGWLGYAWHQARRGKLHDDPIIFAVRDQVSVLIAGMAVALFLLAL